ncbi:mediator of RNA polymerase II transcription subunit 11-like isoform X1 [Salvia splendens]|uniref:mediator of RNA polymerase II transcription subunit 11-like isoform X1 n=1 Tax=Salvia splendens TaxID=180675 RepID=UPI001C255C21|nr:mediator of RNA polymerase II transcription subunit 11-like isoform X1 [Salvia splendens]
MDPQSQTTSLQRLQNVEKVYSSNLSGNKCKHLIWINRFSCVQRIVRVLELAGGVMDEMANPSGPRKELVNSHCSEFMQSVKDIQMTLREEIKSACEYRPFEKCDYVPRISNEICCKKLEYLIAQVDEMRLTIDEYNEA